MHPRGLSFCDTNKPILDAFVLKLIQRRGIYLLGDFHKDEIRETEMISGILKYHQGQQKEVGFHTLIACRSYSSYFKVSLIIIHYQQFLSKTGMKNTY